MNHKVANLSFVCALLIVVMHTIGVDVGIGPLRFLTVLTRFGICMIAVPFFFVASGYFMARHFGEKDWWRIAFVTRLRTLGVPFVIWSLAWWLFGLSVAYQNNNLFNNGTGFLDGLSVFYVLRIFGLTYQIPYYGPMWYLRMLIFLCLISPILYVVIKRKWVGLFFVLGVWLANLTVMGLWGNGEGVGAFFEYTLSLEGLAYFSLGTYIQLHKCDFDVSKHKRLGVICILIALPLFFLQGSIPMRLAIPFFLLAAWIFSLDKQWPGWLTACAFPIYLTHEFWITLVSRTFSGGGYALRLLWLRSYLFSHRLY